MSLPKYLQNHRGVLKEIIAKMQSFVIENQALWQWTVEL